MFYGGLTLNNEQRTNQFSSIQTIVIMKWYSVVNFFFVFLLFFPIFYSFFLLLSHLRGLLFLFHFRDYRLKRLSSTEMLENITLIPIRIGERAELELIAAIGFVSFLNSQWKLYNLFQTMIHSSGKWWKIFSEFLLFFLFFLLFFTFSLLVLFLFWTAQARHQDITMK